MCVCVCTHSLSLYLAIFDTKLTFQSLRLKGEGLFSSVNILLSNGKHTTLLTGFLLHWTPIKFKAKHDSTTDLKKVSLLVHWDTNVWLYLLGLLSHKVNESSLISELFLSPIRFNAAFFFAVFVWLSVCFKRCCKESKSKFSTIYFSIHPSVYFLS